MNPMAQASDRLDDAIAAMTKRIEELDSLMAERTKLMAHLDVAKKAREVLSAVYPHDTVAAPDEVEVAR